MKYLLYCIFEKPHHLILSIPTPTEGPQLRVLEKQGLSSVFSEVPDAAAVSDVARLMDYHRVIESFFEQVTVVPFRFGTLLDSLADIERLQDTRAEHYRKILQKLDGCAEMGIRAIMDENKTSSGQRSGSSGFPPPGAPTSGKLYLTKRKALYTAETLLAEKNERTTEQFCHAFAGLFKDFRSEISRPVTPRGGSAGGVLLSVYFLVPKAFLDRFRKAFTGISSNGSSKLLLSGPWPPYNFVLPGDSPAK